MRQTLDIKHRITGAVLFTCELPADVAKKSAARQLGYAVRKALEARADLAGAYLARANLADANLADAYLAGANLARADLARAYLAGANLADARNLPSGTEQTDPPEPYERAPAPERYARRAERFRARNPDVPVIPDIDRQILGVIESGKGVLNMGQWHTCDTTHCRAGWAIALAGAAGKALEEQHGPFHAGRMIYLASTGRAPHFFASDSRALEDIRDRAAEQTSAEIGQ